LVLRVGFDGLLVIHDGELFLPGFQEGLSETVVGIPELWAVLHFELEYLEGRVGLSSEQEVVAESDQSFLVDLGRRRVFSSE
jgi:hypothetical protein